MNKDIFQGDLNYLRGRIKEQWGKLTDDDLLEVRGKREQLIARLQKRYGLAKQQAEEQIAAWEKQLLAKVGSCSSSSTCSESSSHGHASEKGHGHGHGSSSHKK